MSKPSPDDVAAMVEMAQWLQTAVRTEFVTGLSITLVDESDGIPVPRHVFFALPGSIAALAGGYVLAQHDLAQRMALPPTLAPPAAAQTPQGLDDNQIIANGVSVHSEVPPADPSAAPLVTGLPHFAIEEFDPDKPKH